MTNLNERLDEILLHLQRTASELSIAKGLTYKQVSQRRKYQRTRAKQAITSLIKELVAEAKPSGWVYPRDTDDPEWQGYSSGINEFEQNLLKALEQL